MVLELLNLSKTIVLENLGIQKICAKLELLTNIQKVNYMEVYKELKQLCVDDLNFLNVIPHFLRRLVELNTKFHHKTF